MPIDFLSAFLHSPWMLLGLVVLAIPPIIHLLNRRRYDVVDWGAMQFLKISEVTRRRLMLEELLLMLLRIGLLGLLVFALAGPFFPAPKALVRLTGRANRDVVLIFDGSYSMGALDEKGTASAQEAAKAWALAYLDDLAPGDSVAVLQAKQQVVAVVGALSQNLSEVRDRIKALAPPSGGADFPAALEQAHAILAASQRSEREIVFLGDGQRFGWADPDSLFRWKLKVGPLGYDKAPSASDGNRPRLWAVNVVPDRAAQVPNWALTPLTGNRPIVPVEREVTFRTDLVLLGQTEYSPPHRIRLEVDGKHVRNLPPPRAAKLENGKVPFSFAHRFTTPGSHLVSLFLDPDPPAAERARGQVIKDRVPGDNRQDFAVDVLPALPVLLVDGETSRAEQAHRGTDFLRDALAPARDRNPVVQVRVVGINDFTAETLAVQPRPRVLVLHNVSQLRVSQQEAIVRFLADGGGALVTLGERVDPEHYNEQLYRGGEGWLPGRLEGIEGDELRPRSAVRPDPASFNHVTLELFRKGGLGGLNDARFPRWWKLNTPGQHAAGVVVGLLRSPAATSPFLVERPYQPADRTSPGGRVMVSAVPLDNTWGTNLPDLAAFVPLAHELVYYLAGARTADFNLRPGQPIRFRSDTTNLDVGAFKLQPPLGEKKQLSTDPTNKAAYPVQVMQQERGALLVFDGARETGTYKLETPEGNTIYYVVQPDDRESDLAPCTEEDRKSVAEVVKGMQYENERGKIVEAFTSEAHKEDFWQYFLIGLVLLLCMEVWMTRRMVKNRAT